jgi:hypothetical protein
MSTSSPECSEFNKFSCEIPTTGASSDGETIMRDKSDSIPEVKPGQSNIELGEIQKEIVDQSDIELGDIQKGIVDQSDIGKCVDAGHSCFCFTILHLDNARQCNVCF